MFNSYKGRTVVKGQEVKVYYNLHLHTFSIKDVSTGLVLGHSDIVQLGMVEFKVSESGRQRVLQEKRKNVHAYVVGLFVGTVEGPETGTAYYNPYKVATFMDERQHPLKTALSVTCINKKIKYKAWG